MGTIDGVRSLAVVRARASLIAVGWVTILVASLEDIIKSKRAARRPRDLAVPPILEKVLEEAARSSGTTGRRSPRECSRAARYDPALASCASGSADPLPARARGAWPFCPLSVNRFALFSRRIQRYQRGTMGADERVHTDGTD